MKREEDGQDIKITSPKKVKRALDFSTIPVANQDLNKKSSSKIISGILLKSIGDQHFQEAIRASLDDKFTNNFQINS